MEVFVPGRVCLFGEHSDWAGTFRRFNSSIVEGYALVCGTKQGVHSRVKAHPTKLKISSALNDGSRTEFECEMKEDVLGKLAAEGGFWSYACGVAYEIVTNYHVQGLEIDNYKTDLPIKKGLSSSAAFCVMVARAFNRVYDLKLTIRGEMDIAYHGEIRTPSRCGRLDQCCAFGSTVVAVTFDSDSLAVREVPVKEELHLVLVDLHGQKDTKEILACLSKCYPFAQTDVERGVQQLLGPINKRIVHEAMAAIEQGSGTARAIGALMTAAQAEFDKYAIPACPHELTAPLLHKLLTHPAIQPLVWGGKGVGSQGDGSAQFVARSAEAQDQVIAIIEKDFGMSCLRLALSSQRKLRKAVIPVAGFAPSLFPACKVVPSALLPVMDRDGVLKPAVLILVEEALAAGIEQIAVIVQSHDLASFRSLFHERLPIENFHLLSTDLQAYHAKLMEIGNHVKLIVQETQKGFGHAILCAESFIGNEPFLLMLGDHLYRSNSSTSCMAQLLSAYQRIGSKGNLMAIRAIDESTVPHVGIVAGTFVDDSTSKTENKVDSLFGRILQVSALAEKPHVETAREHFTNPALSPGRYFGAFGLYILEPQVFAFLHEAVAKHMTERGSIGLTSTLDRLRVQVTTHAMVVEGARFDLSTPAQVAASVGALATNTTVALN